MVQYFASDLGQDWEFVNSKEGHASKSDAAGDASQQITKKSLPTKETVAPESSSTAWIMGFPVDEIERDLHRVSYLHKCAYCGSGGAGIGCARGQCHVEFHMPCGLENGAFFEHYGKYRSLKE